MVVFDDKHARALDADSDAEDDGSYEAGSSRAEPNGKARPAIIKMPVRPSACSKSD